MTETSYNSGEILLVLILLLLNTGLVIFLITKLVKALRELQSCKRQITGLESSNKKIFTQLVSLNESIKMNGGQESSFDAVQLQCILEYSEDFQQVYTYLKKVAACVDSNVLENYGETAKEIYYMIDEWNNKSGKAKLVLSEDLLQMHKKIIDEMYNFADSLKDEQDAETIIGSFQKIHESKKAIDSMTREAIQN